jgi:hypothetical protein
MSMEKILYGHFLEDQGKIMQDMNTLLINGLNFLLIIMGIADIVYWMMLICVLKNW